MKCPYTTSKLLKTETKYEYDDDGHVTKESTVEQGTQIYINCCKEYCGAWRDGGCHYNEGSGI